MGSIITYPKISIVTSSFNQANFLEETILSVITQNYPNLEYIIIDGGSTDGSVEIIKKYKQHLAYWISEPDKGHGNALNKGFARATGEIMAWINSDDKYYPYTFITVAEIFNKFSDVNWIQGKNSLIDKSGRLKDVKFSFINLYSYLLYDYCWIQQESVFWRRSLWESSGAYIDEKIELMVDGELWSRFFLTDDLWHLDSVIGCFRSHDKNRSESQIDIVHREMREVINTLKTKLSTARLNSFYSLQHYLNAIKSSVEYAHSVRKKKLFKVLPYFVYTRFIYRLISKNKKHFNFDQEPYDYKLLEYVDNSWVKKRMKFKDIITDINVEI